MRKGSGRPTNPAPVYRFGESSALHRQTIECVVTTHRQSRDAEVRLKLKTNSTLEALLPCRSLNSRKPSSTAGYTS